ncbi:PREDICTED: protein ELYS [Dufourea novaeangliae]|uniref:protein ELYS n=1 Tax=Dufourea novaeangliae TaxID=178035 RepID=UPI0007678590|nr:PREDICTED: protein ELYS [Dufourea novaeangliae]
MKELDEVKCEIRNVVDIQCSFSTQSSNTEEDHGGLSHNTQVYSSFDSSHGGFSNDAKYAWLSHGSHLIVLNAKTGENISSWTFRWKITCVCQFPAQPGELPLLLVGLDNEATRIKDSMGLLCVFDTTTSRILRAIRMPVGVEQVCVVSGGADWEEFNDKRPDNFLMQMDGIACVVLRNLYHLMIDLQRSTWELLDDLSLVLDETSPAEVEFLTTKDSLSRHQENKSKHMVCNLLNPRIEKHIGFNREEFESTGFLDERLTNAIISSTKIGCLISGCLGRVIIWQNNGSVGWISLPVDETMIVTHLALLEPADDPRPFYYLWVVFQDDTSKVPPLLRMYALLFERKYCDRGTNLYFNLEAEPSLKFEFELDADDRVVSLSAIERGTNLDQTESELKRGEDSSLLILTTSRTLLFDLNQWYKEQMPQTVDDCKNPDSILASYNMKIRPTASSEVVSCIYVPRSLQEFPNNRLSSTEELFYPNSLALEWIELGQSKLTFWLSRGVQADLLHELAVAGPIVLTQPSEIFHKCLSIGLVPSHTEVSFSSDHNAQRDMLLSLCLEQRWATFLIRCAKEWSDGSAAYMYPSFLKWGIQRAATIKMIGDHLCVPLFDQSGNNIGESEVQTLRFCCQQLECLSNVVSNLPSETGSLVKQRKALKRVSIYFQVLLWFYDVGLLPESQELEEGRIALSLAMKIPYPYEKLFSLYKEKRDFVMDDEQKVDGEEVFFIDELITRECPALSSQWKREAGDTLADGYYPPPSLQSLLRSYLTDCEQTDSDELECKHQITIYLLMDLAMLLQGSYTGVDQLIKYPSSFKMSPSIIKLTQAFWLLDHEDYHGFLDMMTGQLVSDSDVKDWHHRLVLRTLIRNNQHKMALMYLRVRKPPLSSIQDQSTLIGLAVEHGLVQSAFHHRPQSHYAQLLACFFQSCKAYGKLNDILHLALDTEEEEMFVKFLEETESEDMKLLYYLQRCRYMEANSGNFTAHFNATASKNDHTDMLNAYNATLPDIMKKFSMNMGKTSTDTGVELRYPRPMTYNKSFQGGSNIYEMVIKKAKETFHGEEKFVIPFVTAPCTTLKMNDEEVNINCVTTPKIVKTHRKRTLDEIQNEEESAMRTPDRIKRRKLLEDGDAAMSAAFSTPLVQRKVSHRDTTTETPHSILKIRQLIRNSTSPSISNIQDEVMDDSISDKEKKLNRQIRFNISQSKKNNSYDETNGEGSLSAINTSEKSDEVLFNSTVNEKSSTDSTVLSDGSYTCKHVYNARPRPSLRRTCLQASVESLQGSDSKGSRKRTFLNSHQFTPNLLEDTSKISTRVVTPQISRRLTSRFSTSIHSSAVLSPGSSFEEGSPWRRNNEIRLGIGSFVSSSKSLVQEESRHDIEEPMNIDEEEEEEDNEVEEEEEEAILDTSSDSPMTSPVIPKCNHFKFNSSDGLTKYKNGDISKGSKDQEDDEMENSDNEDEFESFSNILGNSSDQSASRERRSLSLGLQNQIGTDVQERTDPKNDGHFDITDDESSNCADAMVLAFSETPDESREASQTALVSVENVYDAVNITDDESDASTDVLEPQRSSSMQKNLQKESRFSVKEDKYVEDSVHLDNNNSSVRVAVNKSVHDSPEHVESKDIVTTSRLDDEPSTVGDSVTPRVTRSRRASSIAKEVISTSVINSPSKVVSKTPARSRRASSLMKEVLIASVATADEGIKRTGSSGSEDSSGTSSPRKGRGVRASSIAKDIPPVDEEVPEDSPGSSFIKRTRGRRASSIAKDTPLVEEDRKEGPPGLSTPRKTRGRRASSIAKDVPSVEQEGEEESLALLAKRTRGRRASSIVNDVPPVEEDREEGSPGLFTPRKTRGRRASSIAKDVPPVEEEGEEDPPDVSTPKRTRGRKATSLVKDVPSAEEKEEVRTPVRRNTRRAASVQKELPESTKPLTKSRTLSSSSLAVENENVKSQEETKTSKTRSSASGGRRLLRSTKEPVVNEEAVEEVNTVRSTRRRGSSVPKEVVDMVRPQRSSSVAKEVISENFESSLEVTKGRSSVVATISSPAVNTRNRRSSIQSIPEELEEILSVPSKERISAVSSKKQAAQTTRQRRAASVELSQADTNKRTKSTRGKRILKETIVEEEATEVEAQASAKGSKLKKAASRKKNTLSDAQGVNESLPRTKKGRKLSEKEDVDSQFSFSQPDKGDDPPLDQKVIGEVPNYVFSPPHTRSKTMTPDHRRRIKSFVPILSEDEAEEEEEEKLHIVQRTSQFKRTGNYIRITVNHCRTKFVFPKRSNSTSN